jgi:hypothetical protein
MGHVSRESPLSHESYSSALFVPITAPAPRDFRIVGFNYPLNRRITWPEHPPKDSYAYGLAVWTRTEILCLLDIQKSIFTDCQTRRSSITR